MDGVSTLFAVPREFVKPEPVRHSECLVVSAPLALDVAGNLSVGLHKVPARIRRFLSGNPLPPYRSEVDAFSTDNPSICCGHYESWGPTSYKWGM